MSGALIFQTFIGLLTVLAAVYAAWVAKKGKQAENRQDEITEQAAADLADRRQRFDELQASLAAARADLSYYADQLKQARLERETALQEKERLQREWITRNERLLERCQALASQLEAILNGPLRLPAEQQARIQKAVGDVARHVEEDHGHAKRVGGVYNASDHTDGPPSEN